MLNINAIQGRFVKDIELKVTNAGKSFCTFTLACERYRDKATNTSITDWIDCVAWGKTAEFISKYFHKGDMTVVNGRLESRNYEDKSGAKRKAIEVNVTDAAFCGAREKASTNIEYSESFQEIEDNDAELPF